MSPPPVPSHLPPSGALSAPAFRWLHAGAWALLGLALVNLFFRFSDGTLDPVVFFNSDALYLPALSRDLFELGGRWGGWRLTPAPYFFPDMPLYFALEALSGSFVYAVLLYAVVQVVLLVLATQLLVRTVAPPGAAALGQVVAVCVVAALLVAYGAGTFEVMQLSLANTIHFSVALMAVAGLALALRTFRGTSRLAPWLLGALCLLASASDRLFVVAFTVPVGLCLVLLAVAWRPVSWRRLGLTLGILGVSTALGFRAARWLTGRRSSGYSRLRLEESVEGLRQLGLAVGERAREAPGLTALWVAVMLAAVAVLVVRCRQWTAPASERWGVYAVCLFGVLALGTNAGAVVVTGLFKDPTCIRYLPLSLLFPFLGLAFAAGLVPRETWQRALGAGALGVVALAWGVTFARNPWRTEGPFVSGYQARIAACLDANRERHGLGWGVADYWNARLASLFSRTGLWVNQVVGDGDTYPWINNLDWYLARRGERSDYTFVITENLDMVGFKRKFGEPRATFFCEHVEVYVYGKGFDSALRNAFADELKLPRTGAR
ncbi:hypothetical protein [Pyxidicoccus xibeiensis]|uniref:hypothetical protein n=1 Tax=Pyxidicoccus xibeiensis TaxID=2906759 RepID=UPI0020A7BB4C|nr:hypothetical protein [Pyxidicoccus xibeiensis]MCP3142832.1 hypothetical protein [Pyxidicoccus xibeiensis]